MSRFKDFDEYFKDIRAMRTCRATNKYGREVIRVNQNARLALERMQSVSHISKRALASYAIALLHEEFEKWMQGNQESRFGYDVEETDEGK
jgi:5-methylcytosine-specific restriction endonuclease McrBC regulatory subunit McrC